MPNMTFSHSGAEFDLKFSKVDRSKLYGRVGSEALDDKGDKCSLVTMSSDGKTLIPSGGTAFGYVSADGLWRKKGNLVPHNLDGEELTPVKSTLKETTMLDSKASIDEYLGHKPRLAYILEGDVPEDVQKELKDGAIYKFGFSYRGGLTPDVGFVLKGKDDTFWMIIGQPARIEFVGFEAANAVVETEDDEDGLDDLMDFGIM